MATKKKTEAIETEKKEPAGTVMEEIFPIEELYKMKFSGPNGEILKVRKAFRPIGKLEIVRVTEK